MPRFSEELISEICAANDIVDYVSKTVQLKKSGRDYSGLCPFHNEKTPSFHVSADKQLFHCFGCGASGNLVQYVMRTENLDFVDAIKILADNAGINVPEDDYTVDNELYNKKKALYEMNKIAARFFFDQFKTPDGVRALEYLKNRGLTAKTVTTYGIGYAPASYDALLNHLRDKGYSDEQITVGSLAVSRDGKIYDKFRDRIMFPIIDTRGNIIGFGGRIMKEIVKDGYKAPKYLNSSETPVFDKGKNLFSLNFAKNCEKGQIILVEGYMDVISVYQEGIKNVVATLGTALTENQAKLLGRYANEVLICYDSDEAGKKATERAIDILTDAGLKGRVIRLKGSKDPDEYIKKNGVSAFSNAVTKAQSFMEYKISGLKTEYDISDVEGKISFANVAAEYLTKIKDAVELDAYIRKISEETDISREAIYAEYKKKTKKTIGKYENKPAEINVKPKSRASKKLDNVRISAERRLLALIIKDKKIFEGVKVYLSPEDFSTGVYKRLAELIFEAREKGLEPEPAVILNEFNMSPEKQNEAAAVFYNMEIYSDKDATAKELTKSILINKIEQEMTEFKDNSEKVKELIEKRLNLLKNPVLWD